MSKFIWLLCVLAMMGCAEQGTAPVAVDGDAERSLAVMATGITYIDWFGEDGEDLCGGEFIIRATSLSPQPSYSWINSRLTEEVCEGTTIINGETMYEYGPIPRTKYKTATLNINNYAVGSSTLASKASWFVEGSGWQSGGCSGYQGIAIVECPEDTTGGGKGPPNPWED